MWRWKWSKLTLIGLASAAILTGCADKKEAAFPNKSIEFIVPFSAGGAVDNSARIIAAEAEKILGQKILITNKDGGGSTVGATYVSKAKPDGYTVLVTSSNSIVSTLTKDVDYTLGSFIPVAQITNDPPVIGVFADAPYQTLKDLLEAAKEKEIHVGTAGHSGVPHLTSTMLADQYGLKFKYTHTTGASEMIPMLAGGHIQSGMSAFSDMKTMAEQGKIRILGVFGEERDPRIPDVPTFKELGYDVSTSIWRGLFVPAGTPSEVVEKLDQTITQVMESEDVKKKFEALGIPTYYRGPGVFKQYLEEQLEVFKGALDKVNQQDKTA